MTHEEWEEEMGACLINLEIAVAESYQRMRDYAFGKRCTDSGHSLGICGFCTPDNDVANKNIEKHGLQQPWPSAGYITEEG